MTSQCRRLVGFCKCRLSADDFEADCSNWAAVLLANQEWKREITSELVQKNKDVRRDV
jgi:hypothetical protein